MEAIGLYALKSGILLVVFWSIYHFCLRKETFYRFNRLFLLTGGAAALLLPWVTVHYPVVVTAPELPMTLTAATVAPLVTDVFVQESADFLKSFTSFDCFLFIYLTGIGLLLMTRIYGLSRLWLVIRKYGYRNYPNYKLVESPAINASFSFFRFVFLPLMKFGRTEKKMILKHEESHISQYHWVDLCLANGLCLLWWFNPVVWFYMKAIRENHEFLADKAVMKDHDRVEYQVVLVKQWLNVPVFPLASSFCYSNKLKRITMMKKYNSHPVKMLFSLLSLPAMLIFFWSFSEPQYIMASGEKKTQTTVQESAPTGVDAEYCVMDASSKGIEGASVTVNRDSKEVSSATTDNQGKCIVNVISGDSVTISATGYETVKLAIALSGKPKACSFNVGLEKSK